MRPTPAELKALLTDLVTTGAEIVMAHRGRFVETHQKYERSGLVTSADLASEQAMLDLLAERRPADGFISEERGYQAGSTDLTWVLDPLDGTVNFARGSENFGVIAGVLVGDIPVAGAMMLPAINALYLAADGLGAARNDVIIEPASPRSLADATLDHSLLHFDDPQRRAVQTRTLEALLATARAVRCDHSLRYLADAADGVLNGFVYHSLGLWDIVGPSVILKEAGLTVTDLAGDPLDLSPSVWKPGRLYSVLGAPPPLHGEIVDTLRPVLTQRA